ncbi:gamma-mobile-trio recombinase GmtY [Pseudoalteromonas rhizosphaerae]|uniref:gamma-mobile-trio recombinase GmtY n=1 Tax=Pseudoalteromonas rhizosphaerae TaxID=2518973 RepID=UPI0021496F2A|nr:gamma-mobile-trio recombinase GmtY [Pseudoalteromonas rhizosphaerae]
MTCVKVRATLIEDNTGVKSQIPILITAEGEIASVTDYLLLKEVNGVSNSSMISIIRVVSLLLDYMEANKDLFHNPTILFQTFAKRLYSGTIGEDGLDPSGLYWLPSSTINVNKHINRLTAFTDWQAKRLGNAPMNPLRDTTPHEYRLNYASWFRKNQSDYLGHIEDKSINKTIRKARFIKGRSTLTHIDGDSIAFPDKYWEAFFKHGLGGATDPRVILRDKLVLLLIHGGGLRLSEAMALWVTDVFEDSHNPDIAIVKIYNEIDGKAPYNWKSRSGTQTREAYLKENYARIPRIKMSGTNFLGWKSRVVDHKDNYIKVQWFPSDYGKIFMSLWRNYQKFRANIDSYHPYAFISFHHTSLGSPYTINAFNYNYSVGLKRIGLKPNKSEGICPHGHRHNYGRRLERSGLSPLLIRRCLHHKSLESQVPYTGKSHIDISNELQEATNQLSHTESVVKPIDWVDFVQSGFDDIDPQGYFTGKKPKFRSLK